MDSALPNASFVQLLEQLIESKYRERGDPLKWALLYSPADVLEGSPVAFIGLNPGGDTVPEGPSAVAREKGSAYCDPNWREDGKLASLQKQVCLLFAQLGIEPENVLAGNLVPFRSANWDTLQYPQDALEFGKALWLEILERAQPRRVIVNGVTEPASILARALEVKDRVDVPINWGHVHGWRGRCHYGTFTALPHLSHYKIMERPESKNALNELLAL